jgi:hypothetical protein
LPTFGRPTMPHLNPMANFLAIYIVLAGAWQLLVRAESFGLHGQVDLVLKS